MSGPYFSSDPHFGHANIIGYSSRPYWNVVEMNQLLVHNWNSVVPPEGVVYLVGDVSFMGKGRTEDILSRLNGRIILIRGNHDSSSLCKSERFAEVHDELTLRLERSDGKLQRLYLRHKADDRWGSNTWHLHGHSHGNLDVKNFNTTRMDVGVDAQYANYTPFSWADIQRIMNCRSYRPMDTEDHHNA